MKTKVKLSKVQVFDTPQVFNNIIEGDMTC